MTLRNVILLAPSGLVLFAKEYGQAVAQPRLLGSLLTAMTEFATQTTAMHPTYIEMSSMAITMVRDEVARVSCALVHDRNDTASFGRLIACEILLAFVEEYSGDGAPLGGRAQHLKELDVLRMQLRARGVQVPAVIIARLQAREQLPVGEARRFACGPTHGRQHPRGLLLLLSLLRLLVLTAVGVHMIAPNGHREGLEGWVRRREAFQAAAPPAHLYRYAVNPAQSHDSRRGKALALQQIFIFLVVLVGVQAGLEQLRGQLLLRKVWLVFALEADVL